MQPVCGQPAAVHFLSFPQAGTSMIEFSQLGKNNGKSDLVCEKSQ